MGRPGTARNSNGPGQPEIKTIRAFSGLGRAGLGGPNVHLYHKVSGLDNAKQIWDTLKISHEGNDVTMLTKMELVEGELGRFAMIRGEEPTQTYNRLKTLVNKIRSYGST
jgi:hypothetical protein